MNGSEIDKKAMDGMYKVYGLSCTYLDGSTKSSDAGKDGYTLTGKPCNGQRYYTVSLW